ncbi:hypothetical protein XTPLMG728_1280 [Xanthomonas translucens pv. poae]|uniref:SWIM-type domain-containing protein n=1 Tax=Xanthomonas graminis pv. poae TaxID=227946 RepID=A0A0K2ZQX8_9XANT|nr:hypothetical protein [Xanthomonas translucens]UKE61651.1 hypothetical protein KM539_18360 [Xanthomonas translucens pv. poae]CTP86629.1 hypothetical protein XTPLMG728_1280 [Xanthomonas translucens pv. poae]
MTSDFSATRIDRGFLLGITERRYYERGLAYAEEDRVVLQTLEPMRVEAEVNGTETYGVQLTWNDGALHGSCDCPIGQQEEFCKHQVAVALTWAKAAAGSAPATRGKRPMAAQPTQQPQQLLQRWLAEQSPQALQALVLDLAEHDGGLRQRLLSQAQLSVAPPQDWRKAISALLGRKRFMDYRDSIAYAKRLQPLNALLEQARQRDPGAALDLHEYAFVRLLAIYTDCDDSAGHVGDRLRALARLHPEFARDANPSHLAKRLFDLRIRDEWKLLPPLRDYAALLGQSGIATLEHEALRTLHGTDARCTATRLAAEALLEETAHCGGDVQAMLEWFGKHCNSGWEYLGMARRCAEHGRQRQAIEWLERGVKAHPQEPHLPSALAEAYTREGFPEDALQLRWNAYALRPMEAAYLALREAALALGPWEPWRERALAALDTGASHRLAYARDLRIRFLLAEGQAQLAMEMARGHHPTLSVSTLECLLPYVEPLDPAHALTICDQLIEAALAPAKRSGYLKAVDLLPTRQRLCRSLGDAAGFASHLDQLRQRHQRKRNFIELLDSRFPTVATPRIR